MPPHFSPISASSRTRISCWPSAARKLPLDQPIEKWLSGHQTASELERDKRFVSAPLPAQQAMPLCLHEHLDRPGFDRPRIRITVGEHGRQLYRYIIFQIFLELRLFLRGFFFRPLCLGVAVAPGFALCVTERDGAALDFTC
jgi:hypothetical protein